MKSLLAVVVPLLALALSSAPLDDEAAAPDVEAAALALLERFDAAHTERDVDALRALHAPDCRWYEDGRLAYASVDAIVTALEAFPDGMRVETEYSERHVTPLGPRHASIAARFESTIVQDGREVFAYAGVMTAVLAQQGDAWRVVSGHTSTPQPGR